MFKFCLRLKKKFSKQQQKIQEVPEYIKCYNWAYIQPQLVRIWDQPFFVNILLFGQFQHLKNKYLQEFNEQDTILQFGSTYWDVCPEIAKKNCNYTVLDILPIQVQICNEKLAAYPNSVCLLQDASDPILKDNFKQSVTTTCSFFLLHEIPDDMKFKVINNLLSIAQQKVVIIEYHQPQNIVLDCLVRTFFYCFEPYAFSIWQNDIESYAQKDLKNQFEWKKQIFFFGLYQKVIATRITK